MIRWMGRETTFSGLPPTFQMAPANPPASYVILLFFFCQDGRSTQRKFNLFLPFLDPLTSPRLFWYHPGPIFSPFPRPFSYLFFIRSRPGFPVRLFRTFPNQNAVCLLPRPHSHPGVILDTGVPGILTPLTMPESAEFVWTNVPPAN